MSQMRSILTRKRMIVGGMFALGLAAFVGASEGTPAPAPAPAPAPQAQAGDTFFFNPYTLRQQRIKGIRAGKVRPRPGSRPKPSSVLLPGRPPKASPTL